MELRTLMGRAVETSIEVVRGIEPGMLDHPTPCPDYDVRVLLAHLAGWMTGPARAAEDSGDLGRGHAGSPPWLAASLRSIYSLIDVTIILRLFPSLKDRSSLADSNSYSRECPISSICCARRGETTSGSSARVACTDMDSSVSEKTGAVWRGYQLGCGICFTG